MKPYSTAACFVTWLLPHILFVGDFEERARVTKVSCLAWNLGLFPDTEDRERHTENTLALLKDDNGVPPPPGFGEELRMLIALKRDLFPWQIDVLTSAELERTPGGDVLHAQAGGTIERIALALNPAVAGLPIITKALVQIHGDTRQQRATLEQALDTPGLIGQVATRKMLTTYCAQRADLRGYHRMLTTWSEVPSSPEFCSAIGQFLAAIVETEVDTKAVLGILAEALDCVEDRLVQGRRKPMRVGSGRLGRRGERPGIPRCSARPDST